MGEAKMKLQRKGENSSQATLRLVAEKSYGTTYEAREKKLRPSIQPDRSRRGGLMMIGSRIETAITPAMTCSAPL
jgi:hypothetical protein